MPPERPNSPILPSPIRQRGALINELADYVSTDAMTGYTDAHKFWVAHSAYARRCALALAMGDLHAAQRAAEVAALALASHHKYGGSAGDSPGGELTP